MNQEEYIQKSLDYKHSGYNCTQSVVMTFTELTKYTPEELSVLASGFGAGMGCMGATCGALVGAGIIGSLLCDGKAAELTKYTPEELSVLASGFGAGMGCMGATCGALVGAGIIGSLLCDGKAAPAKSRQLFKEFEELTGATICKDIKGIETGVMLCSCDDAVVNAVKAVIKVFELEQ